MVLQKKYVPLKQTSEVLPIYFMSLLFSPSSLSHADSMKHRGGHGACIADYQNHIKRKNVVFFLKNKTKKNL